MRFASSGTVLSGGLLSAAGTAGRLTWSKNLSEETAYVPHGPSPFDLDDGTLHVQSITISAAGEVVNCGGYVVPNDYVPSNWAMTPMPGPPERALTVTVRFPAPAQGESPAPDVSTATKVRPAWFRRLVGREREGDQR